ncbi:hypothetical protein BDA99DRAFT_603056 [Phascolomyces articulosus]|uniref:Uncharacterized protein n=1 Tax=Phascolomyces articulosus TaxID=60185 RepID=A0AAD5KJD4_9FUNG|nr:hypothetical protein BDA99DRAFT_603056 [Phascolomyces articulosus]
MTMSQYQIICHSWPNQTKEPLVNHLDIDFYSLNILSGIVETPTIPYIPVFPVPRLCL